jgi:hypothetical protein
MTAPYASNPNGVRGHEGPARHDSDGQELRWAFQQAGIGRHEWRPRQGNDRRQREITDADGRQIRQDARKMMVERATLIVRIARTVVVGAVAVVSVVMMGVVHGMSRAIAGIGGGVLLARDRMLEMDGDQRHDAGELG